MTETTTNTNDAFNKLKYTRLSSTEAKQKCYQIKNDTQLSIPEKIKELELVAYSRTYDIMGGSYTLQ